MKLIANMIYNPIPWSSFYKWHQLALFTAVTLTARGLIQAAPDDGPPSADSTTPVKIQSETKADAVAGADELVVKQRGELLTAQGRKLQETVQDLVLSAEVGVKSALDAISSNVQFGNNPGSRVLVVPPSDATNEWINVLKEDLTVMSRILRGSSRAERPDPFRFNLGIFRDSPNLDALYLDGHGVVFFLSVDLPLMGSPEPAAAASDDKAGGKDKVWEETRLQLRHGEEGGDPETDADLKGRVAAKFDHEKVQQLQRQLTGLLKHAVNIHGLKTEDWVTVVVQGPNLDPLLAATASRLPGMSSEMARRYGLPGRYGNTGRANMTYEAGRGRGDEAARAVMTLRAKKSDIEAFASGRVNLDQFRVSVSIRPM